MSNKAETKPNADLMNITVEKIMDELKTVDIEQLAAIEKIFNTAFAAKKEEFKIDAVKQIKSLYKTLGLTYDSVSDLFKDEVKAKETTIEKKRTTSPEFLFTYKFTVDGIEHTLKDRKAHGNMSRILKEYLKQGNTLASAVIPEDKVRFETYMASRK